MVSRSVSGQGDEVGHGALEIHFEIKVAHGGLYIGMAKENGDLGDGHAGHVADHGIGTAKVVTVQFGNADQCTILPDDIMDADGGEMAIDGAGLVDGTENETITAQGFPFTQMTSELCGDRDGATLATFAQDAEHITHAGLGWLLADGIEGDAGELFTPQAGADEKSQDNVITLATGSGLIRLGGDQLDLFTGKPGVSLRCFGMLDLDGLGHGFDVEQRRLHVEHVGAGGRCLQVGDMLFEQQMERCL